MEKTAATLRRFGVAVVTVLVLAVGLSGQRPAHQRVSLVTDWSHRHMIYSAAGSLVSAFQLQSEPRYLQQHFRRYAAANNLGDGWLSPLRFRDESEGLWSVNMGNGSTGLVAATVGPGQSPAKFSFDVTTAQCASAAHPDFVVYDASSVPATTQTASGTVMFGGEPNAGFSITVGATTYVWHSAGSCTGVADCITRDATLSNDAANLAAALNGSCAGTACAPNSSATATSSGVTTSLTAKTAGASGDFVLSQGTGQGNAMVLSGGNTGSNAQASIIAYDNLYTGCGGTVPQTYWSYDTNGTVSTSPVLSLDGSQIAFIHSSASGASLELLKWVAGQGSTYNAATNAPAPDNLSTTGSGYASCRAGAGSCLLSLSFANAANDTNSPPYYDYGSDVLFVADNTGHIHKFTGVFGGTPTEVGNPWVTLTSGNIVDGAIYDSVSGRVFAGDSGGFFYNVACTISAVATPCVAAGVTTAVNKSAQLAATTNGGIVDSPIVDGTAGQVYVFASNDTVGVANRSRVWQFPVNFANTAGPTTTSGAISTSPATAPLYAGALDNAYFTSASGSSPTGNLYVCGTSTTTHEPTLYQIAITSNVMATTATTGPVLTNAAATCSGVTEFFNSNNSTDLIFTSVTGSALATIGGSSSGCTAGAGCLMSFTLPQTSPFTVPATTTAGTAVAGGASAVIVDNQVPPGAEATSQVYFSPLTRTPQTCSTSATSGGCAMQASQATLH